MPGIARRRPVTVGEAGGKDEVLSGFHFVFLSGEGVPALSVGAIDEDIFRPASRTVDIMSRGMGEISHGLNCYSRIERVVQERFQQEERAGCNPLPGKALTNLKHWIQVVYVDSKIGILLGMSKC